MLLWMHPAALQDVLAGPSMPLHESEVTDPRAGLCGDIYDPERPDDHLPCRLPAGHCDDNPDDWHSDGLGGMWAP